MNKVKTGPIKKPLTQVKSAISFPLQLAVMRFGWTIKSQIKLEKSMLEIRINMTANKSDILDLLDWNKSKNIVVTNNNVRINVGISFNPEGINLKIPNGIIIKINILDIISSVFIQYKFVYYAIKKRI